MLTPTLKAKLSRNDLVSMNLPEEDLLITFEKYDSHIASWNIRSTEPLPILNTKPLQTNFYLCIVYFIYLKSSPP